MVAERRRHYARSHHDREVHCECAHPAEGIQGVPTGVPPRLEVIAHHHRIKAMFLSQNRIVQ